MATEKKKTTKKTTAKKTTPKKVKAKKPTEKKTTTKKILAKKPTAKKPTAKKTPAKVSTTKKTTVKKTTVKTKPNNVPKIDLDNINLMPLIIETGITGFPIKTTYYRTEMCAKGFYYLVHNNGKYFLFLPKYDEKVIQEMKTGKHVVITRGSHEGVKDCFEIVFDDGSENPFAILLRDEQFSRINPLIEGWHGPLYVFFGELERCIILFNYVYYRITDNLPCFEPIKEEIDKSLCLTPLKNENEIREYIKNILKTLLATGNYPLLSKKLSFESLTHQLVYRYVRSGNILRNVYETNFEVTLNGFEKNIPG
jgi:hypothetical protein